MWPTVCIALNSAVFTPVHGQPRLSAHTGAADNLDAANQGVSNGQRLQMTIEPSFPAPDYLHVHDVYWNGQGHGGTSNFRLLRIW